MTTSPIRFTLAVALVAGMMGCKADEVELTVEADDIRAVMAGAERTVEFEAEFSGMGSVSEGKRDDYRVLEDILSRYVPFAEFDVGSGPNGAELTVEGEIILTSDENSTAAYHVLVQPSNVFEGYHLVQLRVGDEFATMHSEMEDVDYMFTPDRYHPTTFRLKGEGLEVLAPAARVGGESHLIWNEILEGRLKMVFEDGVFDETGAGFFVR